MHMAITVNLYDTGTNGSARRFAEETEESGTADFGIGCMSRLASNL